MKSYALLFACFIIFSYSYADVLNRDINVFNRVKRSVAGALHILTNHAQPIYADVKSEGAGEVTEKPCDVKIRPSHVEPGTVFKVTAPNEKIYTVNSLRKSWPLNSKLDFARNINRLITLATLLVSAIFEFYPLLQNFYYGIYHYMYYS